MAGFLDKLKEKNAVAGAPAEKPAALSPLKPKSPLAPPKTPSPLAPKPLQPSGDKPTAEPAKKPFLGGKTGATNPFAKKETPTPPPIEEEQEEAVAPQEEAAADPVVTPEPEVAAEPEQQEAAAESETVESTEQQESGEASGSIVDDIREEDSKAPQQQEEPKKTGKTNSRKGGGSKKPADKPASNPATDTAAPVDTPTEPSVSYAEAFQIIHSPYVDEEWENFKAAAQESIDAIVISDDMNAGMMKSTISELSHLRQQIWSLLQSNKTMYEQLSSKEPEGLIERVKKTSLGSGTNDLQRKKSGIEACMNYVDPRSGVHINLYEFLDETRIRYNFLKGLMDSIQYKTSILITMSGALKLEKDHVAGDQA